MGTLVPGGLILAFIGYFVVDKLLQDAGAQIPPDDANIWGLMIWVVLAALLALAGPMGMRMVRRGTWYTLTDRRAIIAHWPTAFGITVYRGLDSYPITDVQVVRSDLRGLDTVNLSWLSRRSTYDNGWRKVPLNRRGTTHVRDQRVGFERITMAANTLARLPRLLVA